MYFLFCNKQKIILMISKYYIQPYYVEFPFQISQEYLGQTHSSIVTLNICEVQFGLIQFKGSFSYLLQPLFSLILPSFPSPSSPNRGQISRLDTSAEELGSVDWSLISPPFLPTSLEVRSGPTLLKGQRYFSLSLILNVNPQPFMLPSLSQCSLAEQGSVFFQVP